LTEFVEQQMIHHAWSPEQIAGRLRMEHSEDPDQGVFRETIYQYIYAHSTGQLNKRLALDAWMRAVNARGGFGVWYWDVVKVEPSKVDDFLLHHAKSAAHSEPISEGMLVSPPPPIATATNAQNGRREND
jgi:hypothetical protein